PGAHSSFAAAHTTRRQADDCAGSLVAGARDPVLSVLLPDDLSATIPVDEGRRGSGRDQLAERCRFIARADGVQPVAAELLAELPVQPAQPAVPAGGRMRDA